mmetsp:Transcript_40432/g.61680  ORF Transcript_40432/g.61680 Transcript_40432/m.61680 type:complete len:115 (-) Transcript_40432:994-1338(-)
MDTGAQIASMQSSTNSGVLLKQKSGSPPESRVKKGSPLIASKKSPTRVTLKKGSPTQSKTDVKKGSPVLLSSKKILPSQAPQALALPNRMMNVPNRQVGLGSKSPGPTLQQVDN